MTEHADSTEECVFCAIASGLPFQPEGRPNAAAAVLAAHAEALAVAL